MSNGSQHGMSYVKEVTYGVTPGTPTLKPIRGGKTTLGLSKDVLKSEEIRDDRMTADSRHGTQQANGDIPFELSFSSFDDFLEAVLCGTWTADQLKAGVTRSSFTIQRQFGDLAAINKPFHVFTGCEFNTMELKIAPNAIVSGTFGVIGKGMSTSQTTITGSSQDAATTTTPFDSFTGTLNEAGVPIATITEITLNIQNGIEPRFVVGSKETIRPQIGRFMLEGQITAYFENSTLLDKFIDETESDIDFTLVDLAGNSYTITIPRIKYNGGKPDVSGEGAIFLNMPFEALYDAVEDTMLVIDRVSA